MNTREKMIELEESAEHDKRMRAIAQNGNSGLNYELSHFNTKHGEARKGKLSKEYKAWRGMKNRCYNPNGKKWSRYGGRGISVCSEWLHEENGYSNFLEDMGRANKGESLDRIDNNGNYSKDNCRWADAKTQANNTSNNVTMTYNGVTKNISQWQDESGVSRTTFYRRYYNGLRGEELFKQTAQSKNKESRLEDIDVVYEYVDSRENVIDTKEPTKAELRKGIPVYSGFIKYFPNAIKEVAECSMKANRQHNGDEPLHWAMEKSKDELDALMRHLIDHASGIEWDDDSIRHLSKVCWRSLAMLERTLTNKF